MFIHSVEINSVIEWIQKQKKKKKNWIHETNEEMKKNRASNELVFRTVAVIQLTITSSIRT